MGSMNSLFPYMVDRNSISVYVGRVIKLDDNFEENGSLFVDLYDPNGTDLEEGAKCANKATASYAIRNTHKCWQNPPEIKSKTNFMGSMTATMSGDFHLQNYCFDMQTLSWFTTVSSALNALGIVNIPPIMISMDQTPFAGKAVSINLASALEEFINEVLDAFVREIEEDGLTNIFQIPSLEEVKDKIIKKIGKIEDPVTEIINNIVNPLRDASSVVLSPYFSFIECISLTFQLVKKRVYDILDWTFPITNFAETDNTDILSVRNNIGEKLDSLKDYISEKLPEINLLSPLEKVIEAVYNPVAYLYTELNNQIANIVEPVKQKIVEGINSYIRTPLLSIANTIAMSIQPMVASLPTIVQLVVKYAIKALLRTLLGSPIKAILVNLADSIKSIIKNIIEAASNGLVSFVTTFIDSLTNPVIKEIQTLFCDILPTKNLSQIKNILQEYYSLPLTEPIPLKIYVDGALGIPKTFEEIDWSNPKDIAAFVLAIIELVENYDNPESYDLKEEAKEIFVPKDAIRPIGSNISNCSGVSFNIETLNDAGTAYEEDLIEIDKDELVKEGKINAIDSNEYNASLIYEIYKKKEDFIPIFEQLHTKVMRKMKVKNSDEDPNYPFIRSNLEIKTWITNNITYVETEIEGELQRYIVCEQDSSIPVRKKDNNSLEYISLEKDIVYLTQTIPHISLDTDDGVGEDLIPQYTEEANIKTPIQLSLPKVNEQGEFLYTLGFDYPPNTPEEELDYTKESELTFQQIADLYYCKDKNTICPDRGVNKNLAKELLDKINEVYNIKKEEDPDFKYSDITKEDLRDIEIVKCFKESRIRIKDTMTVKIDDIDKRLVRKNRAGCFLNISEKEKQVDGETVYLLQVSLATHSTNNPMNPLIRNEEETDFKSIFSFKKEEDSYVLDDYIKEYQVPVKIVDTIPEQYEYILDKADVSWMIKKIDRTKYSSWIITYLKEVNFVLPEPDERKMNMVNMLVDLYQHTLNAVSQDNFDAEYLLNALISKYTSSFDKISSVVDGVKSKVQNMIELAEGASDQLNSIVDDLVNISSTIDSIASTIEPALKSTAQAASAVAMQSCSMTQAATGKDFTFSSGDNYDLSTTTTAQAQLPYCKELEREQFIVPNCKALVLAIGAGKQNLFVVDVLS